MYENILLKNFQIEKKLKHPDVASTGKHRHSEVPKKDFTAGFKIKQKLMENFLQHLKTQ